MKIDFDDLFKSKPLSKQKAPDFLINQLNESLPDGLRYIQVKNGLCVIIPKNNERMIISGLELSLTDKQKKILGPNPSKEKILNYCYNSQNPIKIKNEKKIKLNGEEFDSNKLVIEPFSISNANGSFSLIPNKFPDDTKSIVLENENHSYQTKIERVPNDDPYEEKYISDTNKILSFIELFNNKTQKIKINFTFHFNIISTFKEILDCAYIYNGLIDNTTTINGEVFPSEENTDIKKIPQESIDLWTKAIDIEKKLEKKFKVSAHLNKEEIILILKLYKSLITNRPFREAMNLNSINFSYLNKKEAEKNFNKDIRLQYEKDEQINLFGEQINLFSITCVYHVMMVSIEEDDEEYKVRFKNTPNEKNSMIKMYFLNEQELKNYKEKHNVAEEFSHFTDGYNLY